MATDVMFLQIARSMDADALITIFDLYAPVLYKYALRLCADPGMADSIVGDVFAKLLDQFSRGSGPGNNLRAYLFQSTHNLVVDEARYSRRRTSLAVVDSGRDKRYCTNPSLEEQITLETLLQAIQTQLTDEQRHVIILRFLEGFSVRETAQILGKTETVVKVTQHRAIGTLRKSLEQVA